MKASIPTATVHPNGDTGESTESFELKVFSRLHLPDNAGEGDELLVLAAQQRVPLEEGNHLF